MSDLEQNKRPGQEQGKDQTGLWRLIPHGIFEYFRRMVDEMKMEFDLRVENGSEQTMDLLLVEPTQPITAPVEVKKTPEQAAHDRVQYLVRKVLFNEEVADDDTPQDSKKLSPAREALLMFLTFPLSPEVSLDDLESGLMAHLNQLEEYWVEEITLPSGYDGKKISLIELRTAVRKAIYAPLAPEAIINKSSKLDRRAQAVERLRHLYLETFGIQR